jgi:hypothetical protein
MKDFLIAQDPRQAVLLRQFWKWSAGTFIVNALRAEGSGQPLSRIEACSVSVERKRRLKWQHSKTS